MTDLVVQEPGMGKLLFLELHPAAKVAEAVVIANLLRSIIEKQKLYVVMNGKKHVIVEGWQLLGNFLQVLPRERNIIRLDDGSYEAYVDLVDRSGNVVGGSSSLCGMDETRWAKANEYARRSMAVTRATGKAYRLAFSWVMNLAGYEVTPAEEMPHNDAAPVDHYRGTAQQKKELQKIFEAHVITETAAMKEISEAMLGCPMDKLGQSVSNYINNPI